MGEEAGVGLDEAWRGVATMEMGGLKPSEEMAAGAGAVRKQVNSEPEAMGPLCPVCDLEHHREVSLVFSRRGVKCTACGRSWGSEKEYGYWLRENIEEIKGSARARRRVDMLRQDGGYRQLGEEDEPITEGDRAWHRRMEELEDYRMWEVAKDKEEGTWTQRSAFD